MDDGMDYDDEGDGDVDSEDVGPAPKISVTAYAEDSEVPAKPGPHLYAHWQSRCY
jgi:hypothetical protein